MTQPRRPPRGPKTVAPIPSVTEPESSDTSNGVLNNLNAKISSIETRMTGMESTIKALTESDRDLKTQYTDVSKGLASAREWRPVIERLVNKIGSKLDIHIEKTDSRFETIGKGISDINVSIHELTTKLETSVEHFRDTTDRLFKQDSQLFRAVGEKSSGGSGDHTNSVNVSVGTQPSNDNDRSKPKIDNLFSLIYSSTVLKFAVVLGLVFIAVGVMTEGTMIQKFALKLFEKVAN